MEKDLLIGPTAVAAVTHSSLYWLVEGQEEDLGAMARSCWEERMKEAVVRGRRADSAVRRRWGCMLLACLLVYYTDALCRGVPAAKVFLYFQEKEKLKIYKKLETVKVFSLMTRKTTINSTTIQSYC